MMHTINTRWEFRRILASFITDKLHLDIKFIDTGRKKQEFK